MKASSAAKRRESTVDGATPRASAIASCVIPSSPDRSVAFLKSTKFSALFIDGEGMAVLISLTRRAKAKADSTGGRMPGEDTENRNG